MHGYTSFNITVTMIYMYMGMTVYKLTLQMFAIGINFSTNETFVISSTLFLTIISGL